jgi:hypothetical protein
MSLATGGEVLTIDGIRFDDAATYSQSAVARAFNVSTRSVERWRKAKRNRFPAPFYVGNVPHWKGHTINRWLENKSREALA